MRLGNFSGNNTQISLGVKDYLSNPLFNKSAVKYLSDAEDFDYSGFDSELLKYLNKQAISEMVKINSEIRKILRKFKISVKINMKILDNLVKNHLPQTKTIALGIADNLPENLKHSVNKRALVKATSLHDIAKVIMPESIINKAGKLTDSEREIMKRHSDLSYEMLKTTDLDDETLNLIKNHHHSPQNYHVQDKNYVPDIDLQILSMADIYSALREKRSYKPEMTKDQALAILKKETDAGKFHIAVYKALEHYTEKFERHLATIDVQR